MLLGQTRILLLAALCALPVFSQQGTGTISGTVTDAQNAVVTGAEITVRNVGTNFTFKTKANETGFYTAPGLAIGDYEVSGEMAGFKRSVRSGITLQVNQNAQVDMRLDVGQVAEAVGVS